MATPLEGIMVPDDLDMHDPQVIDDYGQMAIPAAPYPLLVLSYAPASLGERTRRSLEDVLRGGRGLPEDWSLALHGEKQVGGAVSDGRGFLDVEYEMEVLDAAGRHYADLLVYGLDVEYGHVDSILFVVG